MIVKLDVLGLEGLSYDELTKQLTIKGDFQTYLNVEGVPGSEAGVTIKRGDEYSYAQLHFYNGFDNNIWAMGLRSGDSNYHLFDVVNGKDALVVDANGGNPIWNFYGDIKLRTPGKTLSIAEGSDACKGQGALLVGGSVTVNTAAVNVGDQVMITATALGGTPGFVAVSIVDGESFTLTSSSSDDASTYAWLIIKAS